jgi:hypothetical protein
MDSKKQEIDYSKIPHEDVTDTYRYTNLPWQFFYDRENGKITPRMFDVLAWIWRHTGFYSGIADRASAGMILADLWPSKKGRPDVATIQRDLRTLDLCGYITLPKTYLHDVNYPITAHGYVVGSAGRKIAPRPKATIGYRDVRKGCAAPSAEPLRNLCGTFCGLFNMFPTG